MKNDVGKTRAISVFTLICGTACLLSLIAAVLLWPPWPFGFYLSPAQRLPIIFAFTAVSAALTAVRLGFPSYREKIGAGAVFLFVYALGAAVLPALWRLSTPQTVHAVCGWQFCFALPAAATFFGRKETPWKSAFPLPGAAYLLAVLAAAQTALSLWLTLRFSPTFGALPMLYLFPFTAVLPEFIRGDGAVNISGGICGRIFLIYCVFRVFFDCSLISVLLCAAASFVYIIILTANTIIYFKNKKTGGKIMSKITGIHHVALYVSDFEKSKKFYLGLGLKEHLGWGEGDNEALMLDTGAGVVEMFASKEDLPAAGRFGHLAFNVCCKETVKEKFDLALSLGAKEKSAPATIRLEQSRPYPIAITCAFVFGPDGESVEFFYCERID